MSRRVLFLTYEYATGRGPPPLRSAPLARGAAGAAWRRAACLCRLSLGRGSCGTCCHHRVPSHQSPVLSECLCLACAPCACLLYSWSTRAAAVRSSARPVSRSVRLMLFRGAASTIVTRSLHSRVCRLARISCLAGSGRVHGGRVRCRRSRVGGRAHGRDHAFYLLHLLCPIGFSSWGRALGLISVDSSRTTTTTTW